MPMHMIRTSGDFRGSEFCYFAGCRRYFALAVVAKTSKGADMAGNDNPFGVDNRQWVSSTWPNSDFIIWEICPFGDGSFMFGGLPLWCSHSL